MDKEQNLTSERDIKWYPYRSRNEQFQRSFETYSRPYNVVESMSNRNTFSEVLPIVENQGCPFPKLD